jgi:hypothetical protein
LDFQHVPSWFHCFLWHRRAYGKNGQILHFWTFQTKLYLSFSSGRDTSWQADRFQNVATVQLFSVTGTILWTCPSWFGVACAALQACVVACFMRIAFSGCVEWWQRADCLARVGYLESALLRGRRSIWCRSVLCGVPCVARAILGHSTFYTLHLSLLTLHSTTLCALQCAIIFTLYTWHSTL